MSFDEGKHELVTITVESFRHLGREGSEVINQLAMSVVGGWDVGAMAKKGIRKEYDFCRLFQ